MAGISIQRRRGTTTQTSSFTGKLAEITVDTTKLVCVVHDGTTAGGWAMSRFDHTHPVATESVAGFLSASDKTKLDGIAGGTSYYQTIQSAGTPQPQELNINFSGNFTATDDSGGHRTTIDLADSGVTSGTYTKVTVDAYGRATVGATLIASDIPSILASKISNLSTTVQAYTLDTFAPAVADINVNNNKIINLETPTASTDAATKGYVDSIAVGLYFKQSCRVASTGSNINLSAPGTTIDAVTMNSGDRILVKDQSTQTQNGIYIYNGSSSPLTRSLDADSGSELAEGTFIFVSEGNVNGDSAWVMSTQGAITIGTTNIVFVQFSASGKLSEGNGITISSNLINVETVSSSRITVGGSGIDLATTAVSAGAGYNLVTVDAYGRVTAASTNTNVAALAALGSYGILGLTSSGTLTPLTLQDGLGIAVTNPAGIAGNPSIAIQTNFVQHNTTPATARASLNFSTLFAMSDDSGNNSTDITLANNNTSGAGTYGSSTASPVIVVNNQGLITSVVTTTITGVVPGGSATGDLTGTYPSPSVATVGGLSASAVASGASAANAATASDTANTIVERDSNGNTAVTGIAQTIHVTTFSATPTFNLALGAIQKITLTGSVTGSTFSNLQTGQIYTFDIIQGSGSYTFAWPTNAWATGGTPLTIGMVNGGHNIQQFYCDGTNLYTLNAGATDIVS